MITLKIVRTQVVSFGSIINLVICSYFSDHGIVPHLVDVQHRIQ